MPTIFLELSERYPKPYFEVCTLSLQEFLEKHRINTLSYLPIKSQVLSTELLLVFPQRYNLTGLYILCAHVSNR